MIDLQIWDVTLGTPDPFENLATSFGRLVLLIRCRLEVIKQIEFEIIDETSRDLVNFSIAIRIVGLACCERWFQRIARSIQHHSGRSRYARTLACRCEIRIYCLQSHFVIQSTYNEFSNRDCAALMEERPYAEVRIDALNV